MGHGGTERGGTDGDTGATNRKLGSDMADAVTGGGLHGKDLSKADVSVNVYLWSLAQVTGKKYEAFCTIGSDHILVYMEGTTPPKQVKFSDVVSEAKKTIEALGGFEKLAEWGFVLFRLGNNGKRKELEASSKRERSESKRL